MQTAEHHHHHPEPYDQTRGGTDPVCGMSVQAAAQHRATFDGRPYLFCRANCLKRFQSSPAAYVTASNAEGGPASSSPPEPSVAVPDPAKKAAEWTCPMHPEIVRDAPGACPKCGMALEPRTVSLDQPDGNPELADMTRRFVVAAAFTVPLLVVAMAELIPPLDRALGAALSMPERGLLGLLLALPICLWAAWPFYARAAASVKHRSLNMFTLIGLGVSVCRSRWPSDVDRVAIFRGQPIAGRPTAWRTFAWSWGSRGGWLWL